MLGLLIGQIFGLISSFFSDGWLPVVLDGKSSQEYPVKARVPQGNILGPTLFSLFQEETSTSAAVHRHYVKDMSDRVQSIILLPHMAGTSFMLVVLTRLNVSQLEHLKNTVLPVHAIIADLILHAFVSVHVRACIVLHGYFALGKTNGPTTKAAGSEVLP